MEKKRTRKRKSEFPNLPKKKICPTCKKKFGRPVTPRGKALSDREWFTRKYCCARCAQQGGSKTKHLFDGRTGF